MRYYMIALFGHTIAQKKSEKKDIILFRDEGCKNCIKTNGIC
ncbi:hypothetical protein CLOL250_01280 [Clostridium sp. L2-50]|nr:hypothetical protein CLOL250_01280 [Clostridium sp. L2-50]